MDNNIYQAGNTVKLEVEFFDYDGITPFEPASVKVIIYDQYYNVIQTILEISKNDIGKYSCDYQTSIEPQFLIYEWNGEKDSFKSIKRGKIRTVFI